MTKDDVFCVDIGEVTLWASLCAVLSKGSRTLTSERKGVMGFSLCAGISSCMVKGDTARVVVVAAETSVQMMIHELGTLRMIFAGAKAPAYKLLLVIFDNESYGRVASEAPGALGTDLGPSPTRPSSQPAATTNAGRWAQAIFQ